MEQRPFSAACERNREPILKVLRRWFADRREVLEIGSGTGQHAVHFAAALPQLAWHASDLPEHHAGIRAWMAHAQLPNLHGPFALDVRHGPWPARRFDAVFSANTLHIMGWDAVRALFRGLPGVLEPKAIVVVYGPFNYAGRFTSESNARFDASLREADPERGIRDFEAVDGLAQAAGLVLVEDVAMPANNRCLVWRMGVPGEVGPASGAAAPPSPGGRRDSRG